jgi:hypothetical protein
MDEVGGGYGERGMYAEEGKPGILGSLLGMFAFDSSLTDEVSEYEEGGYVLEGGRTLGDGYAWED